MICGESLVLSLLSVIGGLFLIYFAYKIIVKLIDFYKRLKAIYSFFHLDTKVSSNKYYVKYVGIKGFNNNYLRVDSCGDLGEYGFIIKSIRFIQNRLAEMENQKYGSRKTRSKS